MSSDDNIVPELPKVKLTKAEKKAKYRTDYPEPIKSRRVIVSKIMENDIEVRPALFQKTFLEYFETDFRETDNIFESVVKLFKAMPDRTKNNLDNAAGTYLKTFLGWLSNREDSEEIKKKYLTKDIQILALGSCSGVNHYFTLISDIFDLQNEDLSEAVMENIKEKIAKLEFKEAADIITKNNFKERFSLEDIVIPLVLQDKGSIAYEYMRDQPKLQRQYMKWLDQFIGKTEDDVEAKLEIWQRRKIMTVRPQKFIGKTLEKYMNSIYNKVSKEYEFDVEQSRDSPNFDSKRSEKALKHLVTTRFDQEAKHISTDDVYFQHVRTTLKQCTPEIREGFLFYLWTSNNQQKQIDALSWVRLFKLDVTSSEIPGQMRDFFREKKNYDMIQEADDLIQNRLSLYVSDEHNLKINVNGRDIRISIVENDAAMESLCTKLKFFGQNDDSDRIVGVDTEWKPAHLIGSTVFKIAIMQVYIENTVYLVDCVKLETDPTMRDDTWVKFAQRLLMSKELSVIGFDLKNDIDALLSINALKNVFKLDITNKVLDLKRFTENVHDVDSSILELTRRTFKLADLTEKFLNISLNKAEQCSNWQSRPLRKQQIEYAAMDAVVVVDLFKHIGELAQKSEKIENFEIFVSECNIMAPKKESSKKDQRKMDTLKWEEIYEALKNRRNLKKPAQRPQKIKCIVDTMLLGYGKHLRRCGIDVIIPIDFKDLNQKLNCMRGMGREDRRYILTVPSKSYETLKNQFMDDVISFPDMIGKPPIDQVGDFFDHFNITLYPDDICLRCIDCNSENLAKFPSPVVHFLHQYNIIHLQNVIRDDMSEFPLEKWYKEMKQIDPQQYEGIAVKMSRPSKSSDWVVATTSQASLHVTKNIVIHNDCVEAVDVRINKVPDDTFQRDNLIFYICGDCGKVSYDGKLINPGSKSTSTSASNSNESVIINTVKK